jgi:4-amino-4-deoxy-L-arabinose transferase-like glycosyltransferase
VETNPPASPSASTESLAARIGWAVLILATLYVCYFSHLGAIGFVGPDEPRYAWIARDMVETGDWVTPRLYGKPWFEKPPLYYWGAALSFKLFGVSEAAARLPSAVSALLATLALAWLALRLYGVETARWLLLLLPTTVGMIGFSHAAATDMPFSALLTIAMVAAAVVLDLTPTRSPVGTGGARAAPTLSVTPWLALIAFGFFVGLAVLAKGPAAIILCGGAVFFWALFTKRWRDAFRLLHPTAIAAFCVTALPWYILCARRNPDFLRVFIIEHNFKRYLTPEFQHVQPWWYYGPILLIALLPWTPLLLWSASLGTIRFARTKQVSQAACYFLLWPAFCITFFSVSQSKLPGYVLPVLPAICIIMARSCAATAPAHVRSFRLLHLGAAFLLSTLFALTEFVTPHFSRGNENFGIAVGLVIAVWGTANLILGGLYFAQRAPSYRGLAAGCGVLPILLALSFADRLLPSFFRWDPSGRSIARELQVRKIPNDKLAVKGMSRGLAYSLGFYLQQEVNYWDRDHPAEGYLLTNRRVCKDVVPASFTCEEIPFDVDYSAGTFLYRVKPARSLDRPPGSGQPQ